MTATHETQTHAMSIKGVFARGTNTTIHNHDGLPLYLRVRYIWRHTALVELGPIPVSVHTNPHVLAVSLSTPHPNN